MVKRQRRSRAESSVYWRQQIADWRQSGQTIRAFCSRAEPHGIAIPLVEADARRQASEDPGRVGQ